MPVTSFTPVVAFIISSRSFKAVVATTSRNTPVTVTGKPITKHFSAGFVTLLFNPPGGPGSGVASGIISPGYSSGVGATSGSVNSGASQILAVGLVVESTVKVRPSSNLASNGCRPW